MSGAHGRYFWSFLATCEVFHVADQPAIKINICGSISKRATIFAFALKSHSYSLVIIGLRVLDIK